MRHLRRRHLRRPNFFPGAEHGIGSSVQPGLDVPRLRVAPPGSGSDSTTTLKNVTVNDNFATFGGGLTNFGTLTVADSTFDANQASEVGGTLESFLSAHFDLRDSGFTGNSAGFNGGAVACGVGGSGSIHRCNFSDNPVAVGGGGGAIYVLSSALTIANTKITGINSAGNGGGPDSVSGTSTLTNCSVNGNPAVDGGGISSHGR